MSDENNDQEPPMQHIQKLSGRTTNKNRGARTNFSVDVTAEPTIVAQPGMEPPTPTNKSTLIPPPGGPPMPVSTLVPPAGGPPLPSIPASAGAKPLHSVPPPLTLPNTPPQTLALPSPQQTPTHASRFQPPAGGVAMFPTTLTMPQTPSSPTAASPPPMPLFGSHLSINSTDGYNTPNMLSPTNGGVPPQFSRQPVMVQSRGEVQVNQQESMLYKAMETQVATARNNAQLAKNPSYSPQADTLTALIPTVFSSTTQIIPPNPANKDHVFLCGPVGASTKKDLKDLKPRWAVLYRDRLDIYNKFADSKPWLSWPLTDCLVQSARSADSPTPHVTLTNMKGESVMVKAENGSAANTPPQTISTTPPPPIDLDVAQRTWFSAIKARAAYCEFIAKCKANNIAHPDERLLHLYDAQYKAPNSMHLIISNATTELYSKLPPVPNVYLSQIGKHQPSGLPNEGFCLDLQGGNLLQDTLSRLSTLLSDPDSLPIHGVKFDGAELELASTEGILQSLASNTNSSLVQLDLSGAKCLSPEIATPTNEPLLEMLTKFITSPHLTRFTNLTIRSSNLTSQFMNALSARIQSASRPITAPLEVIDFSYNKLDDACLPALVGLLAHSEVISNNLAHLNLSWNLFTDVEQLATWLTLHRPTSSNYVLHQQTQSPYKPIRLQGLYLQGCSSVTDRAWIKLARSLLWHVHLATIDISQCLRLQDAGIAAFIQACQINESIVAARFNQHKLTLQGLTALRLFYRYGNATQHPELFGNDLSQFSLVGLASEAEVKGLQ